MDKSPQAFTVTKILWAENSVRAWKRSMEGLCGAAYFHHRQTQVPADSVARETSSTATQLGLPSTFAVISMWLRRFLGCCAA